MIHGDRKGGFDDWRNSFLLISISAIESHERVTYEISPNEYDFKNATRDIINGLETSVGQE